MNFGVAVFGMTRLVTPITYQIGFSRFLKIYSSTQRTHNIKENSSFNEDHKTVTDATPPNSEADTKKEAICAVARGGTVIPATFLVKLQ